MLHSLAYPVTSLGPGQRIALWVAGCPLRCKGCITSGLLSVDAGKPISIKRLTERLVMLPVAVDGITLTGGEPFAQAAALALLLDTLKDRRPHWNVLTFSGYSLEQMQLGTPAQCRLLALIDILVDGPYVAHRPGRHPLTASANQRVRLLTPRAKALADRVNALPINKANLGLHPEADDWLIGIIDSPARQRLHRALASRSAADVGDSMTERRGALK